MVEEALAISRHVGILWLALGVASSGCASVTTKITGSSRAGAEELLLTGISDRLVGSIDFHPLAGHRVYLETAQLRQPIRGGSFSPSVARWPGKDCSWSATRRKLRR